MSDFKQPVNNSTYGISVYERLRRERFEDAEILNKEGHWNGSTYFFGFAIECYLKWRICGLYRIDNLTKFDNKRIRVSKFRTMNVQAALISGIKGHDLNFLAEMAESNFSGDTERSFSIIASYWSPDSRYWTEQYSSRGARRRYSEFYNQVSTIKRTIVEGEK